MKLFFNRLYLPITVIIGYLSVTLILFEFGPINYYTPDKALFYFYQFYYLFALAFGYIVAISLTKINETHRPGLMVPFKYLVLLAIFTSLIENANIARLGSLFPTNIIQFASSGFSFSSIAEAYFGGKNVSESYSSNRTLNILSFLFSWSRLFLLIHVGFNIHRLPKLHIFFGLLVSLIYPLGALSQGLNKPVMEFAIIFLISLLVSMRVNRSEFSHRMLRQMIFWKRIGIALFFLGILNFSNVMESRGVTIDFLEYTSPVGYISVECGILCVRDESGFMTGMIWLNNYLVQGYHGFSLAIQEPWTTTIGFGSSPFLLRQFEVFTGTDLRPFTYQFKTDGSWGEISHWHSIYTHFANDVHFFGVGIIMLLMGGAFGFTWKLAVMQKNAYALILIPIYVFMFIFFPANNQVFGFISSLSSFIFANFLMVIAYSQGRNAS